jgi:hypothetical protein
MESISGGLRRKYGPLSIWHAKTSMKPVFAETFNWYALANCRDQWRLSARMAQVEIGQRHIATTTLR